MSTDTLLNILIDSHKRETTSRIKRWTLPLESHRGESKVCHHCYDDRGCYGWHYYPRSYGPRRQYYEEPTPEDRRGYLEEDKRILEQRLKEIETRIAETNK
jgi:hypothetical protein